MGSQTSKSMEIPDSVKSFVDSVIETKKVVIFSKSYCPFCTKAKNTFAKYPLNSKEWIVIEIENREDCNQIQEYLKQLTGGSSVPRVFIDKQFIGGGDDTVRLDSSGDLRRRLQECNALTQ